MDAEDIERLVEAIKVEYAHGDLTEEEMEAKIEHYLALADSRRPVPLPVPKVLNGTAVREEFAKHDMHVVAATQENGDVAVKWRGVRESLSAPVTWADVQRMITDFKRRSRGH